MIFTISFASVMVMMFGVSALWPMTAAESERGELFHQRLLTPVGGLPEDRSAIGHGEEVVSPFGIVGVCVACIGVLMLIIQPWIVGQLAGLLNAGLGVGLVLLGVLLAAASWRNSKRKAALETASATPSAAESN